MIRGGWWPAGVTRRRASFGELSVSETTVTTHVARLPMTLGIRPRAGVVLEAGRVVGSAATAALGAEEAEGLPAV